MAPPRTTAGVGRARRVLDLVPEFPAATWGRDEMRTGELFGELAALDGIKRTHTMVAFEVFSQHDLEALFSIGN